MSTQLILNGSLFYIIGAVVWAVLWLIEGEGTARARMALATPIWPLIGLPILINKAYEALVRLIIDAKIGGHR